MLSGRYGMPETAVLCQNSIRTEIIDFSVSGGQASES
jgi:hypothetical protein